jgi:hypothetical protein
LPARFVILPLALLASFASAQSPASNTGVAATSGDCHCSPPKLQPFTGHVFDADTLKPIAGAQVRYLDDNPPYGRDGKPVRGVISGVVATAQDGSFTLPADLPLATYEVFFSAPGYYVSTIYDSQRLAAERSAPGFLPRPSHEIGLRPSHDLVAIGASQIAGARNDKPSPYPPITASAFEPIGNSIVVAGPGPGLWHIDLNSGKVTRIALPEAIRSAEISITSVAWDGSKLLFACSDSSEHPRAWIGSASAPDFQVMLVPAPDPRIAAVSFAAPSFLPVRFKIEEGSSCDEDDSSPHCGQGGTLSALDTETGRKTTILEAPVGQLSYLTDPIFGGVIVFAENTPSTDPNRRLMGSAGRFTPGLTILNLAVGTRSHLQLPGWWGRDITFHADQTVKVVNDIALRIAYTVEGDCDPNSTEKSQPGAPGGPMGFTPNNWSLCVVTVPLPADSKPPRLQTPPTRQKTR